MIELEDVVVCKVEFFLKMLPKEYLTVFLVKYEERIEQYPYVCLCWFEDKNFYG